MNLLDLLRSLVERPASAEVIPRDPEAARLLNEAMTAYGDVIRAAHADPRQVNVYAGPRAKFLGESNAAGFFQDKPGYVGMGQTTKLPNTVMVGPTTQQVGGERRWLGMPVSSLSDPQSLQQQTLAHELGHFLTPSDVKGDREFLADVIAANPSSDVLGTPEQQYQILGPLWGVSPAQQGIMPGNVDPGLLLRILGQYSSLFRGPVQRPPLSFQAQPQ